jgi:hypothetical protein
MTGGLTASASAWKARRSPSLTSLGDTRRRPADPGYACALAGSLTYSGDVPAGGHACSKAGRRGRGASCRDMALFAGTCLTTLAAGTVPLMHSPTW